MTPNIRRKLLATIGIFVLSYLFWFSLITVSQLLSFNPRYNTYPQLINFSLKGGLICSLFSIWHLMIFRNLKKGARFNIALTWIAAIGYTLHILYGPGPKETPGLMLIPIFTAVLAILVTVVIFSMTWLYSKMSRYASDKVD